MADTEDINEKNITPAEEASEPSEVIQQNTDSYVLKILSGPHIGAEIPLNLGSYTIGKTDECDVILKDEFISDIQLTLTLDQNTIQLSNIKENTSLSGVYIDENQASVNLFDIIGIGSTFFALGVSNHSWPNLEIPKKISYKKQLETVTPDEDADLQKDNDEEDNDGSQHRDIKVDQDSSHLKKRYASTLNFLSKQPKKMQIGVAVSAFIAFVLLLIIIFYFVVSDLTSGPKYTPNEELEATKEVLKDLGLEKKLQIVGPVDGIVIIKGYVPNQKMKADLQTALTKKAIPNQLNIYTEDKIIDSVKNVLNTKNLDLKIAPLENGVIELEGVVDSASQLQNIVKAIQTDVPGITNVQTSVFVKEDLYNSLETILNNYNLSQLVTLLIKQTNLSAQGSLTENQKMQWDKAKAEIDNLLPKDFLLTDGINVEKDKVSTDILKAQLWGVDLAGSPYLVFTDGTKYYIGDKINTDLTITGIEKQGISLMYKNNKLFYDYNNKVQWIVE